MARAIGAGYVGHQTADDHRLVALHGVPVDELLVLRGVGRARRGQEVDRLQQIRLALGVIAM